MRRRLCLALVSVLIFGACAHETPTSSVTLKPATRDVEVQSNHDETRCVVRSHTEGLLFCVQVVCTTKSRNPARMLRVQSCGLVEPLKRPLTAGK